MNILLVGEESAGIQILRSLVKTSHRIVAVMASPSKKGAGRASLWNVAEQLGCRTWSAKLVKDPDFAETIRRENIDILLNAHSLFIINKALLEVVRIGSFNMHPGPLPRYAGLNAVSWAIYRGETRHGVTIHHMVPDVDAGPIVYQSVFEIDERDTALSVFSKCVRAGVPLMLRLLEVASVNPDEIPRVQQNLTQREYFGAEIPENGRLVWSRSAREVVNLIRACDFFPFRSPWGHPTTRMRTRAIAIVKALRTEQPTDCAPGTVGAWVDSGVQVACADTWISVSQLAIDGQYVNPKDVLRPGDRLGDELGYNASQGNVLSS